MDRDWKQISSDIVEYLKERYKFKIQWDGEEQISEVTIPARPNVRKKVYEVSLAWTLDIVQMRMLFGKDEDKLGTYVHIAACLSRRQRICERVPLLWPELCAAIYNQYWDEGNAYVIGQLPPFEESIQRLKENVRQGWAFWKDQNETKGMSDEE